MRAGYLAPAARPSAHSRHRPCQVLDARPSCSKICGYQGDRPAVSTQRCPCSPNIAVRLSGTRHHRGDYRRSTAPPPDGQALATMHSLRVGRSAGRIRVRFLSVPLMAPFIALISTPISDDRLAKRDAKIGPQRQKALSASSRSVFRHGDKPACQKGRVFAGLSYKNQRSRKNKDWLAEEAV